MGTRGLYGFRMNGMDKTTYNHYDSYPDCLGSTVAEFCEQTPVAEMRDIFSRITLVREDSKPTKEQIVKYAGFCNLDVSHRTAEDWYCLMRNAQGELAWMRDMVGEIHMIDNHRFIEDSLFCEYAYIINLDEEVLEFWIGFQQKPWEDNRYGQEPGEHCEGIPDYYPCRMYATFPLGSDAKDVVAQMNKIASNTEEFEDDGESFEDKAVDAAEQLGWTARFYEEGDNKSVCFSNSSPEGEDLELEFYYEDADDLVKQLRENYEDFDVDEHVYEMLSAKHHGCSGVPSARDLVDDADEIESMYCDLYEAIEKAAA